MGKRMYKSLLTVFVFALLFLLVAAAIPISAQTTGIETLSSGDVEALDAEPVLVAEVTKVHTDNDNGVSYSWYGYEDGTAEIYQFDFSGKEVVMDIPSDLEGYTVTKLTGSTRETNITSLTIPESITYFGESTFEHCSIDELYYNAVDAKTVESAFYCPFAHSNVGRCRKVYKERGGNA